MLDLQQFFAGAPADVLGGFAGRVFDSLLVGAVVAWVLSLGRAGEKRAARMQIAEQLCRVFGMRLWRKGDSKKPLLEQLPSNSMQGWASLDRLQWSLDLHRAELSASELTLMQALIEDLLRIRANQFTMELRIVDEYLGQAAKRFLPPAVRQEFLEHARQMGMYNLTNSTP